MRAMIMTAIAPLRDNPSPLVMADLPDPASAAGELLIRVGVCGVCHTELDEIEGRTPPPDLPMIPGHQVVGRVEALGKDAEGLRIGDRVGVAWIFSACGHCEFCQRSEENLCARFVATGRDAQWRLR